MQEKTFTRRGKIRAMTFLAAGGVVLGGFALQGQLRAAASEALLARHYEYAFSELTAAVSELDTTLQKGQYATSAGLFSSLCSQAFRQALSAQTALGALPYGNVELEQTAAFLARTGDYALALARLEENSLTDEQRETFSALSQRASTLSAALESLQSDLYAGTLALDDVDAVERRLSQKTENGEDVLAGSAFQDIEEGCSDLPTLIYDGPFSDHLLHASPKCLEGLETVNRDEARAAAAAFFGLSPTLFTPASQTEGTLPTYGFSAVADGGELWVEVTETGGQVLQVLNSRSVGPAQLTREEGMLRAAALLERLNLSGMEPTYSMEEGGRLIVNFAYAQDGVRCYPDLIKVTIALDNGAVVGYEAHNYLMNHTARTLSAPAVAADTAQAKVGEGLTLLSRRLALIPTAGQGEVLCHEFQCEDESGRHCLIYVNAQTGEQEQILLLLEDESGTLVR